MEKIKTYQDFKKYTTKELMEYSNREDLTKEEFDLFGEFLFKTLNECKNTKHIYTQENETIEHYINRKNMTNE